MQDEQIQDTCEETESGGEMLCAGKSRTSIYKDELKKLREEAKKSG